MNFEDFGLDARILAGVKAAGYETPTPIQQQAIPVVLEGRDVLGLAQTGTGKTAAFALPIIQKLTKGPLRKIRALIIAPTRELAEQIHESFSDYGKQTKLRSVTIYGGVGKYGQANDLRRGPEIVVACPGRLLDHIGDGNIDLSQLEILVLDEADRMCDMGFLPDIQRILKHIPAQRQTLFFSATMPTEIRGLADGILKNPVTVQIGQIAPAKTVSHALYPTTENLKTRLLLAMLEKTPTGRVLIFTRTKRRARNLALDLENKRYRVAALQGNMAQNRRQEAINGFRDGKYDIMVATDIAARGIDVSQITHVINFDMPDTADAYTHRIGRTGRAQATGEAFTFTTVADELMVRDIERVLGSRIERRRLEGFDYSGFSPEARPGKQDASSALKQRRVTQQKEREAYWSSRNEQVGQRPQRPAQSQPAERTGSGRGATPQRTPYVSNGAARSSGRPAAPAQMRSSEMEETQRHEQRSGPRSTPRQENRESQPRAVSQPAAPRSEAVASYSAVRRQRVFRRRAMVGQDQD